MTTRVKIFLVAIWVLILGTASLAQTPERRLATSKPQTLEQPSNGSPVDPVADELGLLRKSLQTLNERLRVISENLLSPDSKQGESTKESEGRISTGLDLLGRAEQRAELLRKQLLELIEKETNLKSRLVQINEDLRPENIERAASLVGTTRTLELRDTRRRALENDKSGYESLLNQTSQSRQQLEDAVRQADAMVARLRQRVLPLIDKEIEKINPDQVQ